MQANLGFRTRGTLRLRWRERMKVKWLKWVANTARRAPRGSHLRMGSPELDAKSSPAGVPDVADRQGGHSRLKA